MNKADETMKSLEELAKTLPHEELVEFVEKLEAFTTKMRFRFEQQNRREWDEECGGWL